MGSDVMFGLQISVVFGKSTFPSLPFTIEAVKVKGKFTCVQELRLCTGRTAHRGNRSIALLFFDHGT